MIATARACAGTPFHDQGRAPGVGLDCIGLIVIAMRAAGFAVHDRTDYGRRPDGKSLGVKDLIPAERAAYLANDFRCSGTARQRTI